MKKLKYILAVAAVLSAAGCTNKAQEAKATDNPDFEVELLFEVDGCRVYRFKDNGSKYFTDCDGSVSWTEKTGGKHSTTIYKSVD